MDLIGGRILRCDKTFDQRRGCRLADTQRRTGEHRRRRWAGGDMDDVQRPRQLRAAVHLDHGAVGHHRGIQRDHRIGFVLGRRRVHCLGDRQPVEARPGAAIQHLAQRLDPEAVLEILQVRQLRHEKPSTSTSLRTPLIACAFRPLRPHRGGLIRRRRLRQDLAHQGAKIGVFPVLDPPVRQPPPLIAVESELTRARHLPAPGSRLHASAKDSLSVRLASVFATATFIRQPHPRTGHSRTPRVPAPVPCRRS